MAERDDFRMLLEEGDARKLVSAWSRLFPHMPAPETVEQAEIVMHHARTQAGSVQLRHRAYSHTWLCERSLPSGLPDDLKPMAERLFPVKALGVGISVNYSAKALAPAGAAVRTAMEHAVLEAQGDGKLEDSAHVSVRMREAREREEKALFGRWRATV